MEIKKYIKRMFKPSVAKRAKAMRNARRARSRAKEEAEKPIFAQIESKLAYEFKDKSILSEALTHPGSVGLSKKVRSNQRLEFLGDAVLQAVVTDTVFKRFEEYDEGTLTKIRIALTQGSFLAELSVDLGIPNFLIIPKGAEHLRETASAAEDALEAVVGAIYLDSDFDKARGVILGWYRRKLEDVPDLVRQQNPKGALQEAVAKSGIAIEYKLLSQSGPDHQKVFEVEVRIDGKSFASASASSKKSAESKAARLALKEYLKIFPEAVENIKLTGESLEGHDVKSAQKSSQISVKGSAAKEAASKQGK